jgi:outer membrane lipoprotein-sorting protein
MLLTLVLVLSVSAAPDNNDKDAEKLFQQMEETLLKAKTLDVSFHDGDGEGKVEERSKGTLVAMTGNKVRLQMFGQMVLVSDGTRMLRAVPDEGPKDTPKDLDFEVRTWLARSGVLQAQIQRAGVAPVAAKDRFRVSDFKLGIKEKIGERETQRLDYQLTIKGEDAPFSVTVWIDLKTKLPVKRQCTFKEKGETGQSSEIYEKLTVDEKVDDKVFNLPK